MLKRFFYVSCVSVSFGVVGVSAVHAQTPLNFIAITPCRVANTGVSTAPFTGPFGAPALPAATARSFPIPSSSCGVPANAAAYSLNITVIPTSAAGVGYVTIWPTGKVQPIVSTLNVPLGGALANAAIVAAGASGAVSVYVSSQANIIIDIDGYFVSQTSGTQSTALGTGAANAGSENTAIGFNALQVNSGSANTSVGSLSLSSNTSGNNNVALGSGALQFNATGAANNAIGAQSLLNNLIGTNNNAVGFNSLWQNTIGMDNTAIGDSALSGDSTGSWNIAIGSHAGESITGSYNIDIGNPGQPTDANTIRLGASANQTSAYVAGIYNVNIATGSTVLINSNGQLGTIQSSRRYKEDIQDMGSASALLMRLRPVTFRYKQALSDGSKPLQYGLIGEEVEKVFPELVVHGPDGRVDSVAYHELPSLLLDELQNQYRKIEQQARHIAEERQRTQLLEKRIELLEKALRADDHLNGSNHAH